MARPPPKSILPPPPLPLSPTATRRPIIPVASLHPPSVGGSPCTSATWTQASPPPPFRCDWRVGQPSAHSPHPRGPPPPSLTTPPRARPPTQTAAKRQGSTASPVPTPHPPPSAHLMTQRADRRGWGVWGVCAAPLLDGRWRAPLPNPAAGLSAHRPPGETRRGPRGAGQWRREPAGHPHPLDPPPPPPPLRPPKGLGATNARKPPAVQLCWRQRGRSLAAARGRRQPGPASQPAAAGGDTAAARQASPPPHKAPALPHLHSWHSPLRSLPPRSPLPSRRSSVTRRPPAAAPASPPPSRSGRPSFFFFRCAPTTAAA